MSPFYRHIKLDGPSERKPYTSVQSGSKKRQIPPRDRTRHGRKIQDQLKRAWDASANRFLVARPDRDGIYLEFVSAPGFELMIKSLENLRQGIRLCNVRTETDEEGREITYATVFVPQDKRNFFLKKVAQYLKEETESGKPRNADLINSIEEVRTALFVASFWTDDNHLIPGEEPAWCEVWLRTDDENAGEVVARFKELVEEQGLPSKSGNILFPERAVKLVQANRAQLQEISMHSDDIAEYRRARDTADFFLSLKPYEQHEWADELLSRLSVDATQQVTICILDTGANRGHPLLSPVLPESACLTVRAEWGIHDHHGHGTLMAGMAAYGNLMDVLSNTNHITLYHTLESVKILPPKGGNEPELWGHITSRAISLAEINAPDKKRVVCSAVAAEDTRDRGRPTSWSGAIDNITSGATDGVRRLVILAAGNITAWNQLTNYPDTQITDTVHDPGQSWNALTVGAYTQLTGFTDPALRDFQPLAQENQLSPFSTTSLTWESQWPNKPDVLFEGGNVAVKCDDPSAFDQNANDLSLVSTYYKPQERLFEQFNMTSAAAAQAAHFAARIQAMYPEYWPETIRGLIVHSARWPEALFRQFVSDRRSRKEIGQLLRTAGYGVPDLEKALYCAANSLTLVAEAEIQPFFKENGRLKTNEMHLYRLPWPKEELEALGEVEVTMRITLSYFIEPGPGEIGWKDRYRYPSHGLRFKLNAPTESEEEFIARINKAVRDEEYEGPDTQSPSDKWMIGRNSRDKGSVHSDIWKGTAVELASTHWIAVHPSVGWWRERAHLKKVSKCTRYSLIVSIETPAQEVDIYAPVYTRIKNRVPVPISAYV